MYRKSINLVKNRFIQNVKIRGANIPEARHLPAESKLENDSNINSINLNYDPK